MPYVFGPRLEYIFQRSLKLSLLIPKRFDAFQVLKWFPLLLEVTCVIFVRVSNTDVWQAIVARATKPRKNCSKPPQGGSIGFFTITAEIHARSLVKFYCQYADRHMNLKFMRRVSKRERAIRQFVIVKNKLMSVFNASAVLLTMNFVITLSK